MIVNDDDVTITASGGELGDSGAEEATPEVVEKARSMGWVPESEWKGAPPKNGFLDPAEYVRRGEKIMPIVNARARKAEEEVSKLRGELELTRKEHRETISRIERMSSVALAEQRRQIENDYAARIDAAAEVGDKDAVRQARKDEKEALAALDKRLEEPEEDKKARETKDSKVPQDVLDWIEANPWYEVDDELKAVATAIHVKLLKEKPGMSLADNLAEVRRRVAKRYPEQFEAANEEEEEPKRKGSPVEGGSRTVGSGGRSLSSKLPADAKAQAKRFIEDDGLFLEPGETPQKNMAQAMERYAAQYFGDEK